MAAVLGETVQQRRREKGWSVPQLSKRSGVAERIIHEIEGESPTYVPSEANTALLADALRMPAGPLLAERERSFERWKPRGGHAEAAAPKGVARP